MDKTFSNEQIRAIEHLIDLQKEINDRIMDNVQNYLKCPMDDETIKVELDALQNSLENNIKEKFNIIKFGILQL